MGLSSIKRNSFQSGWLKWLKRYRSQLLGQGEANCPMFEELHEALVRNQSAWADPNMNLEEPEEDPNLMSMALVETQQKKMNGQRRAPMPKLELPPDFVIPRPSPTTTTTMTTTTMPPTPPLSSQKQTPRMARDYRPIAPRPMSHPMQHPMQHQHPPKRFTSGMISPPANYYKRPAQWPRLQYKAWPIPKAADIERENTEWEFRMQKTKADMFMKRADILTLCLSKGLKHDCIQAIMKIVDRPILIDDLEQKLNEKPSDAHQSALAKDEELDRELMNDLARFE
jgi:hypothetical protein